MPVHPTRVVKHAPLPRQAFLANPVGRVRMETTGWRLARRSRKMLRTPAGVDPSSPQPMYHRWDPSTNVAENATRCPLVRCLFDRSLVQIPYSTPVVVHRAYSLE